MEPAFPRGSKSQLWAVSNNPRRNYRKNHDITSIAQFVNEAFNLQIRKFSNLLSSVRTPGASYKTF